MTEKGFTLIEILAVIIILMVIVLLVGPKVLEIIQESKQNAYDDQIEMLIRETKAYSAENSYDLVWAGTTTTVTIKNLVDNGYIKANPTNPLTGAAFCELSFITITKTGVKYSYAETMYDDGEGPCA